MIRRFLAAPGPAILALAATIGAAIAQSPPPGVSSSEASTCSRLESQLAGLDRGIIDPATSDQVLRYEDAANRQQAELDRLVAQARRTGCQGSGFFLFGFGQPPQCDQLNGQIQRMRANLDRIMADLQQLRGGRGGVEGQRRAILTALAQNNCGPQYRVAAPSQPQGFLGSLFGSGTFSPDSGMPGAQNSTFRTICVRTCDGFFFPISYATVPGKFRDDELACRRMCPAAEVALFSYRNPGEDVAQAVSISGRPYTELPNAFRYRQEYNPACSCRRAGESWGEAMRNIEDRTIERGDVIVTEEKARAMSQPKPDVPAPAKSVKQAPGRKGDAKGQPDAPGPRSGDASLPSNNAASSQPTAAPAAPASEPDKRNVRAVGPQFIAPKEQR
jgi:hypothetical protein